MQRIEAIPFKSFKEKIRLTKELSELGRLYVGESYVIVDYWEVGDVKNGKKLTRKEKIALASKGYDPIHYLSIRRDKKFIHRATGRVIEI